MRQAPVAFRPDFRDFAARSGVNVLNRARPAAVAENENETEPEPASGMKKMAEGVN